MILRGRSWVALWLVFILATLGWVVARQTTAHVAAVELRRLREQRSVLEAERAELQLRIQQGTSRSLLIPKAEALGLRLPSDSEIVDLRVDTAAVR